jgi:hypothetical protein
MTQRFHGGTVRPRGAAFVTWRALTAQRAEHPAAETAQDGTVGSPSGLREEQLGLGSAKQIKGGILQVEAGGDHGATYRLLFAVDVHASQMLPGLVAFSKGTASRTGDPAAGHSRTAGSSP